MAFMSGMSEEELAQQAQGQANPSSSSTGGVLAGGSNAPAAATPTSGSGYTNLDKYLGANAGQGGGLADTVTGEADKEIGAVRTGFSDWGGTVKSAGDAANGTAQADGFVSGINSDPTKVDQGGFKKFTTSGYGGPTSAARFDGGGFGKHSAAFSAAGDTASKLNDRPTQKATLSKAFKSSVQPGQQYTGGMANLDSFILGGDEAAQDKITAFQGANGGLNDEFKAGVSGLDAYLGGSATTFGGNQTRAKGAATTARSNLQASAPTTKVFTGPTSYSTDVRSGADYARMEALDGLAGERSGWVNPSTVKAFTPMGYGRGPLPTNSGGTAPTPAPAPAPIASRDDPNNAPQQAEKSSRSGPIRNPLDGVNTKDALKPRDPVTKDAFRRAGIKL